MPKKNQITVNESDEKALRMLHNTGHATQGQLEGCGLTAERVRQFEEAGFISKAGKTKNGEDAYRREAKGKRCAQRVCGLHNAYKSQSVEHDTALAQRYSQCTEAEQLSWKTEGDHRDAFKEYIEQQRNQGNHEEADKLQGMLNEGLVSPVDGSYTNESGTEVLVEIITDSYGKEELVAKEVYVQITGATYEPIRI